MGRRLGAMWVWTSFSKHFMMIMIAIIVKARQFWDHKSETKTN